MSNIIDDNFEVLDTAFNNYCDVSFEYDSLQGEHSVRGRLSIEEFDGVGDQLRVICFDHDVDDYRSFYLSGISNIEVINDDENIF